MKPKSDPAEHWSALTERYFAAECTPQEEERLRHFLTTPEGAGHEFDELRAVMGYLSVGRQAHREEMRRLHHRSAAWRPLLYAAAAIALLLTIAVPLTDRKTAEEENVCVVYIHGERCTDTGEVMRQMKRSMQNVQPEETNESVKSQLTEIFQLLNTNNH